MKGEKYLSFVCKVVHLLFGCLKCLLFCLFRLCYILMVALFRTGIVVIDHNLSRGRLLELLFSVVTNYVQ